jgi:hypothetical protein
MIFFIIVLEYAKEIKLKDVAIMQSEYKNKKKQYYF